MNDLPALRTSLCARGRALLGAWGEIAEGGRPIWQQRHVQGPLHAHLDDCAACNVALQAWGGALKLSAALNPLTLADPEE